MFPELDDQVLIYLNDDGTMVEPEYYVPIIPFALVNGISGIGTGFSCNIPAFNPLDLIRYLVLKINNELDIMIINSLHIMKDSREPLYPSKSINSSSKVNMRK